MLARVYAVTAILFFAVSSCSRIPESEFDLRMESRLPKFIDPAGARSPQGYTARVEFYDSPHPVRVIVRDSQRRTIFDARGGFRWHPRDSYQGRGQITYPSHMVVSFPSGEDIFEQRAPEPILYISDDPALWQTLQ
jgi:hypothetical protein